MTGQSWVCISSASSARSLSLSSRVAPFTHHPASSPRLQLLRSTNGHIEPAPHFVSVASGWEPPVSRGDLLPSPPLRPPLAPPPGALRQRGKPPARGVQPRARILTARRTDLPRDARAGAPSARRCPPRRGLPCGSRSGALRAHAASAWRALPHQHQPDFLRYHVWRRQHRQQDPHLQVYSERSR